MSKHENIVVDNDKYLVVILKQVNKDEVLIYVVNKETGKFDKEIIAVIEIYNKFKMPDLLSEIKEAKKGKNKKATEVTEVTPE